MSTDQGTALTEPRLYINRELSWLEFNQRVLDEAADPSVPLLERLKFLAITASNLDEFFMVRVAGLKQKLLGHSQGGGPDGLSTEEQLSLISKRAHEMGRVAVRDLARSAAPGAGAEQPAAALARRSLRPSSAAFSRSASPRTSSRC